MTAPTPGWPGHSSRSYGTTGRQPEPREDRTSGTLPDSWLSTPFCRNANTLKAGGQPKGTGSMEDGLSGDPGAPLLRAWPPALTGTQHCMDNCASSSKVLPRMSLWDNFLLWSLEPRTVSEGCSTQYFPVI